MPDEDLFHEGSYHYRRTPVLVIGSALVLIFVPFTLRFFWRLVTTPALTGNWWAALIAAAALGLFAWVGGWLLRAYWTDRVLRLSIDRSGVRYDTRFFPWQEIGGLRCQREDGKWQLVVFRSGLLPLIRPLMTDEGLTGEQFDALMAKLQQEVTPVFGHLRFAPLASGSAVLEIE